MPAPNNVTIYTWGTEYKAHNFIFPFKKNLIKGENVGHAAVKLTFPADARGDFLIKTYCVPNDIPFEKKHHQESTLEHLIDKDGFIQFDEQGNIKFTKKDTTEDYYEVYFSWWPSSSNTSSFSLSKLPEDKEHERIGVSYTWPQETNPHYIETRRITRGLKRFIHSGLSRKDLIITLGPAITIKYPKMPTKKCKSISLCKDISLQNVILQAPSTIRKTRLNKAYRTNKIKLLVNYLLLYEQKWNSWNFFKNNLTYIDKKIEKLNSTLSESVDEHKIKKIVEQINTLQTEKTRLHASTIESRKIKTRIETSFNKLFGKEISSYATFGKEPDHIVQLPTTDEGMLAEPRIANEFGLDLESMLQTMSAILTENRPFDLWSKNCSSTTLKILLSGIIDRNKEWLFKGMPAVSEQYTTTTPLIDFNSKYCLNSTVFNPQFVYNTILQLEKNFTEHRKLLSLRNPARASIVFTNMPVLSDQQKQINSSCEKELLNILQNTDKAIDKFKSKTITLSRKNYQENIDELRNRVKNIAKYFIVSTQEELPDALNGIPAKGKYKELVERVFAKITEYEAMTIKKRIHSETLTKNDMDLNEEQINKKRK